MKAKFPIIQMLSALLAGHGLAATVPYSQDFEGAVGPEWSLSTVNNAHVAAFTKFSGRFTNQAQTLTLSGLTVGTSYTVGFDLYVIDSWDGNSGPDYFKVVVDGTARFRETFSNYNGNPPSQPQTFAGAPDVGRTHLGFSGSYVDAIYRRIEVPFTATAATVTIAFQGENLQDVSDESWGVDNVAVQTSASLDATTVESVTLPAEGGTTSDPIDRFSVTATRVLTAVSANAAASYDLRRSGADGVFGNGDDAVVPLVPAYASGKTVSFVVTDNPLQPGTYRFRTIGLLDGAGLPVTDFARVFSVSDPLVGRLENIDNNALELATALPMTETPSGSGFLTALGVGTFSTTADVDYWRFDAEAGDRVTVRLEADALGVYPQIYLQNGAGANLVTAGGDYNGTVQIQNYVVTAPGSLLLRVFSNNAIARYQMRVDQARGLLLEVEGNDSVGAANVLPLAGTLRIAGALPTGDSEGDYFRLGTLNAGNAIDLNVSLPAGGVLVPGDLTLNLYADSNATPIATAAGGLLSHTLAADGVIYARVRSGAVRGLRAQFVMGLAISDGVPPSVTGTSLPAEAGSTTDLIDRFTVSFSEEMRAATVNDPANFELRSAGPDGVFDNGDDAVYGFVSGGYTSGLSAAYRITNGPLQPGSYRFRAATALLDRVGNGMAAPFERNFAVAGLAGFPGESQSNGNQALATTMSLTTNPNPDGTFSVGSSYASGGNNSYHLVSGRLDGDAFDDLVVANYGSSAISVLLGRGDGSFAAPVTYPSAANPHSVVLGDLNGDGNLDVFYSNYGAASAGVRLGNGDGTLGAAVNYAVGSNPHRVVLADFNADGQLDAAVANYGSNTVSVFPGNGDGTLGARVNVAVPGGPLGIAAGDVNADGSVDLVTANYNTHNLSVMLGNGAGAFGAPTVTSGVSGSNPYALVLSDFNGDGALDAATSHLSTANVGWFRGNGDGTFAAGVAVSTGFGGNYHLTVGDLNADSRPDLVVANYNNSRVIVLGGNGDGTFQTPLVYSIGANPIAAALGDYNKDGRVDIATVNHSNATVTVLLGNNVQPLVEDPVGSGLTSGTGRGRLQLADGTWDEDYWSFSGTAGHVLTFASETPGNPGSSGLRYDLYRPDGAFLTRFYADSNGRGQSSPVTLPISGRYTIGVFVNHGYEGEYRIRVSAAGPPWQWEDEGNDSVGGADPLVISAGAPGHQVASVGGYIANNDTAGDYFRLGTQGVGTTISLTLAKPSTSPLVPTLQLFNAAGTVVAAGTTSLSHTIGAGGDGVYFARVSATPASSGLMSVYLLEMDAADIIAPLVTGCTLPAEGTTSTALTDKFSLSFSEDLVTGPVNSMASYELRFAGADGVFDNGDDFLHTLIGDGYSGGLSAAFRITSGPLQPGSYRFTVATELRDRAENRLEVPFVRLFSVANIPGYVFEGLANGSLAGATGLSLSPGSAADGSFSVRSSGAIGANAYQIVSGRFNADAFLDLVITNYGSGNVSVLLGNGNATFAAAVNYPTGANPFGVAVGDLDGDGRLDLVTANGGNNNLSVRLGNGDGTFGANAVFPVGSAPRRVVLGDFNGDSRLDAAVANEGSANASILAGNGDGTFAAQTTVAVGGSPVGIASGDVNGDGRLDLVVANYGSDTISVLAGNGAGGFAPQAVFPCHASCDPYAVVLRDFDGDGRLDAATSNLSVATVSLLRGNGDGTFGAPAAVSTGFSGNYHLQAGDLDGDGIIDLAVANYSNSRLIVVRGRGDGSFDAPAAYLLGGNPIAAEIGDFNQDGRADIATANHGNATYAILTGNGVQPLAEDPVGSGFRFGTARGNLSLAAGVWDEDYWGFSGKAGDVVTFASETPGNPGGSGLRYDLYRPDGTFLTRFYADGNGRGQSSPVTLPLTGRYTIGVFVNQGYEGEYRFRVTTAPPPWQWETEGNDSIGTANGLAMTAGAAGTQVAKVGGYVANYDTAGDYYRLGTQGAGTTITLGLTKPDSSPLVPTVQIVNAAGTAVATGASGADYEIPAGADGVYYARVSGAAGSIGLMSVYGLEILAEDSIAPVITACTLPAEGTVSTVIQDRFSLTFSEDLVVAPVNTMANFELRHAGVDGEFGNADDVLYTLSSDGYSGGLGVSYRVTNGPLQPGAFRYTVAPVLVDRAGNVLAAPFIRNFSVANIPGYVFENLNNGSPAVATSLSLAPGAASDGSFSSTVQVGVGANPYNLASGHLNEDGRLDVVTANHGGGNISVLLGNGNGTFAPAVNYAVGPNPFGVALGDLNGDGQLDVVVANSSSHNLMVRLGNGDGTFGASTAFAVGTTPRRVVLADFNGDARIDAAVANEWTDNISVLLGNGNGTFATQATYAAGDAPVGIDAADLNGDGRPDIVAANYVSDTLSVYLNNGSGGFSAQAVFAGTVNSDPYSVVVRDFNGDGRPDAVTSNLSTANVSYLPGTGPGTFGAAVTVGTGFSGNYHVGAVDFDGDAQLDLAVSNYSNSRFIVLSGNGNGTFGSPSVYSIPGNPIASAPGDFNGDGRMDLATCQYGNSTVAVFLGNGVLPLAEDPVGSGLASGTGRGNLPLIAGTWDEDYWSFSGTAGDIITFASETPGSPGGSGLRYDLYRPDGSYLTRFYGDGNGRGQSDPVRLPVSGRYSIGVFVHHGYEGEYRFRVTTAKPPVQWETEANNSIASANVLALAAGAPGHQVATVGGYLAVNDTSGDYFRLGNQGAGTVLMLRLTQPVSSPLVPTLQLYNSAGVLVASGASELTHTVAAGGDDAYFARVNGAAGSLGLMSVYQLEIDAADIIAPQILGSTLPAEGTAVAGLIDRFTLSFSEELEAAPVVNTGNFELRHAGVDGEFDNADDTVYALSSDGYSGGLSASYRVTAAPLQPGFYRFKASTALLDRAGNPMASEYVQRFAIATVAGYVMENRDNNTRATATGVVLEEDPAGHRSAGARGFLPNLPVTGWDVDYWKFDAVAGDLLTIVAGNVGNPGGSGRRFDVYRPDGTLLQGFYTESNGLGQMVPTAVPVTGTYTVAISIWYGHEGEYRFRVSTVKPPLQLETEPNGTVGAATALSLATSGDSRFGSVAGTIQSAGELDYFNLGSIAAGQTIYLTARRPGLSPITPVVSVYTAANAYMPESGGGRPFDGVAEVRITTAGTYFAAVRNGNPSSTSLDQYVLDVQVVPTGSLDFPNLIVSEIVPPSGGGTLSGQTIQLAFTVRNGGALATPVPAWFDRVALSKNNVLGDGDDIPVGTIARIGALDPGGAYAVNRTFQLPDGLSGDYFVIVETDSGNAVNEFVLEADNIAVSETTFPVTLAPYPDLRIEGMAASGPNGSGAIGLAWNSANRGNRAAAGWKQRMTVTRAGVAGVVSEVESDVTGPLNAGNVLGHSDSFAPVVAGRYTFSVLADSRNEVFEHDGTSNASAESNNTASVSVDATRDLSVPLIEVTPDAGLQSGNRLTIRWTDRNNGNLPLGTPFYDRVTVRNLTTGENLLVEDRYYDPATAGNGVIGAGETRVRETGVNLPDGLRGVGVMQVEVVADFHGQVAEYLAAGGAEGNNVAQLSVTSAIAPYPDLQVTGLALAPATVSPGTVVTVSWIDRNEGIAPVRRSWYDRVVAVNTTTGSTISDQVVHYDIAAPGNGELAAASGRSRSAQFTVPNGAAGLGQIRVTVTADTYNGVFEFNAGGTGETNNGAERTVASANVDFTGPVVSNTQYNGAGIADGSVLTGSGRISAAVADPAGIGRVEFYLRPQAGADALLGTDSNGSDGYSAVWNAESAANGNYVFTIRAFDTFSNETVLTRTVSLVLAPPPAPVITVPVSGFETNQSLLTVRGTAVASTQVMVRLNGVDAGAGVTVAADGAWQIPVTLVNGANQITARASNAAGAGPASNTVTATLDLTVPSPPGSVAAVSREDGRIRVTWTASGGPGIAGYHLYRAAAPFSDPAGPGVVRLTSVLLAAQQFDDTPAADGTWHYRLTATSVAGNVSVLSESVSAVSDRLPPSLGAVVFTPRNAAHLIGGRFGTGVVDVDVRVSEPLNGVPFFSLVPASGGFPLPVTLREGADPLQYGGSFAITEDTAAGSYQVSYSMRDANSNRGAGTSPTAGLVIDTKGPAVDGLTLSASAPILNDPASPAVLGVTLHLDEVSAGVPELQWSLTRLPANLTGTAVVLELGADEQTWSGTITLPVGAGAPEPEDLRFSFRASDDLGNEGREIKVASSFEVYQGTLPAFDAPSGFSAVARAGGIIDLGWSRRTGASGYQVYRSAVNGGPGVLEPLTVISDPEVLTFSDAPGEDGEYHYAIASLRTANGVTVAGAASVPPVHAIADEVPPAAPHDMGLTLASNGILSQWVAGIPAEAGVRYRVYRAAAPISASAGLTPLTTTLTATRYLDPSPVPALRYYAVAAVDAAGNESALSNSAYLNATLWAVSSITVEKPESGPLGLSWTNASPDIRGYKLFLGPAVGGTLMSPTLLPSPAFADHGYVSGDRKYSIVTVDSADAESPSRSIVLPGIEYSLVPDQTVRRGLVSRLRVSVRNLSETETLANALAKITLAGQAHQSEAFSLAPLETREIGVVVGGYASLTEATAPVALRIESRPEEGALLRYLGSGTVAVADGGLAAEVIPGRFTRGGNGSFQFRVRNTSSETVEVVSAKSSGGADSPDLRVRLIDPNGNVLSGRQLRINVGPSVVTVADGTSVLRMAPGGEFLSEAMEIPVPETTAAQLTVQVEVDRAYYRYGRPEQVTSPGTSARAVASLTEVSYDGVIASALPAVSNGDQPVVISGRAVASPGGTVPVPNVALRLGISSGGFERVNQVTTDDAGNFSFRFQPLATEAGRYSVWVSHPDLLLKTPQATFVISRVTMEPGTASIRVPRNYTQRIVPVVRAGEGTTATNLRLEADGVVPAGISLTLDARASLGSGENTTLPFSFIGDSTAAATGSFRLRLVSDENAAGWASLAVEYSLTAATAAATFTPNVIDTGVNPGGAESETFRIRSVGLVPLKNVQLALVRIDGAAELPPPAWANLAVAPLTAEIPVGEELPVTLNVQPPADTAPGDYFFDIRFKAANYSDVSIPVRVVITASGTGNAIFKVVDLLTLTPNPRYVAPGNAQHPDPLYQGVLGATIQLQSEDVASFVRSVTTDGYGEADFRVGGEPALPAGRYKYRVTADGHDSRTGRLLIRPGVTLSETVLIPNRFVTIEWDVVPITIEDRYEILLEATFETNVPAPVVTVNPPILNLPAMCAGSVFYGEFAFTNHGLIRANSFTFVPPASDEYNQFELLDTIPTSIDARTTIVVPYKVTSKKSFPGIVCGPDGGADDGRAVRVEKAARTGSGGDCIRYTACFNYTYKHKCPWGDEVTGSGTVCANYAYGNCGGTGGPGGPGGGYYYGPGGGGPGGGGGGGLGWGSWGGSIKGSSDGCFPDFFDCKNRNPIGCWVNYVTRQFEDEALDLETLVPGSGNVVNRVRRFYRDNRWNFEHVDAGLVIKTDGTGPSELKHLGSTFSPVDSTRLEFTNGRDRIRRVSAGWKLNAANGNWREFDENGRLEKTGRDAATLLVYLYDADGNVSGLGAADGTSFLTFTWSGGHLTGATDVHGRTVAYEYSGNLLSTVTDSEGAVTRYFYDGSGRMDRYVDATGLTHRLAYDGAGHALSLLDEEGNGRLFSYDYDKLRREYYLSEQFTSGFLRERWYDSDGNIRLAKLNGQLVREVTLVDRTETLIYGDGSEVVQVYDENGAIRRVSMPDGSVQEYEYDPATRMLSKAVDPAGVITLYQRDAAGNVLQLTEAAGLPEQRVTVFAYNSAGKLVTERVTMGDGMGTTERSYTYDADGRIATRTDETGKVTRYEDHDANGYATRVVDPDNRALQFVYDASGRMKSRQDALGNRWQFEHDAFNNVTATIDAAGGRSETYYTIENLPSRTKDVFGTETSRIKYGPDGRITEQRDAAGRVTVNSYDDFGRLWKVTNPSGEVIEYRYKDTDPEGARPAEIVYPTFTRKLDYEYATRKVTTTDWVGGTKLRTTIHEIDTRGNVVAITDNEGRSQTFGYDALGRMTRAESAGGLVEVFGYNRFDQLTTYTSPDEQVWEYGYSDDGLRVSETSPEGRVRRFEYTDAGKLERTIEANGDVEEIGYDAGGRATSYEYAAGATPAVVQKAVTFSYDADGRISGYTMPGSSAVYGYDAKGRKTSESVNYGAFTKTQSWTYNADDSLATHTNAAGTVIEYLYDAGGRLESIELPGVGQITYGSRYGGRVGAITLPGGVTQTFSYDPLLRPTGMTMRKADGTAVYAWTEAFDGLNQVQERVMDGVTESFGFDASGRLTMAGGTAFTYDGRGNRTSRTGVPGLWVYNDDDELETAGGAAFGYDARGNRTSRTGGGGNQGYTYDAQGLLTTVVTPAGTVSYRYDPFGRRLAKTVGGVTTYFSPSDDGIEAEFDAAGNEVASYGYDPASEYGQRALWKKVGPVYYWYGFDKLGTPCVMVDSDGVVVWKASYDVFGAATVTVATVENHLRLPGQYFDAETGLHYNWRRYYDPATGRFLSRDPVRDEYNHFLYAQNNPLTKFDPDGLRAKVSVPIPPGGGICKVYTSLDFCECGVKCGGSLGSSKAKGAGCELAADVDLCNGRNGNGPGGFPAPKVCVAAGCKVGDGTCKAELLKACYDFSKKKWAASGPAVGCKAKGPGKSEGEIKTPPIFRSGERDGWGY